MGIALTSLAFDRLKVAAAIAMSAFVVIAGFSIGLLFAECRLAHLARAPIVKSSRHRFMSLNDCTPPKNVYTHSF
jgi:hypothetical protein